MTGLQDILPFKLDLWMSIVQKQRQLSQWHMTTMTTMIAQCCFLANTPLEAPAHWHASNWQLWKSPWGREVDFCRRKCLPLGLIWLWFWWPQKMATSSSTSPLLELTKYTLAKKDAWLKPADLGLMYDNHDESCSRTSLCVQSSLAKAQIKCPSAVPHEWDCNVGDCNLGHGMERGYSGLRWRAIVLSSWKQETHPARKIEPVTIEYRLVYRSGVSFPFFRVLGTG